MALTGEVKEDRVVQKLEALCGEIESLREALAKARDRIIFLEERIASAYDSVITEQPAKAPPHR